MRKLLAALAIMVASLALFEGCAPIPLPHYAAWKPRRVEQLLNDSENLRLAGDEEHRVAVLRPGQGLEPGQPLVGDELGDRAPARAAFSRPAAMPSLSSSNTFRRCSAVSR